MSQNSASIWNLIEPLLSQVERPSRYIGSEWIASQQTCEEKPNEYFSFCMAYPDTYELGQPNQAIRILVNAVNAQAGFRAERAYLPAPDMIALMRENDIPAFSLESCLPISAFDVLGITLPHELCATNVLEFLDLSGIALLASERGESDPFVIGGGPCACNPEPFAPFFDVITIGEGEQATPELIYALRELRDAGLTRGEILRKIATIPGCYVPSMYESVSCIEARNLGKWVKPKFVDIPPVITKCVYSDFGNSSAWEDAVVPFMEIVHDRLNVEILRGCARGCRFCQAGMMYRPVRERSVDNIVNSVICGLKETGYEEVSLTSLSSTDHSQISEVLSRLNDEFKDSGVRVSIPSQRLDSFGVEMASLVAGRKKGGLTFAPEAGTQRLRDVINKNVTDEELFKAASAACGSGWRRMKLYFMIGLPTETDDDLRGIAQMCNRTYELMKEATPPDQRGNLSLGISINIFVPKAQTPFQWEGQISTDEARRRVSIVKSSLRYKAINVSYHEPKTSHLEAAMSRGGREVAEVILNAWKLGARFDAWSEYFDASIWDEAAKRCDVDLEALTQVYYPSDYPLPWSHISFGVDDSYFAQERARAYAGATTPDCTYGPCTKCGVCMNLNVRNDLKAGRR